MFYVLRPYGLSLDSISAHCFPPRDFDESNQKLQCLMTSFYTPIKFNKKPQKTDVGF